VEKQNFQYLFVGLMAFLLSEPFLGELPRSGPLIQLAFSSILVAGVFSLAANRLVFRLGLGLAVVAVGSSIAYLITDSLAARLIDLAAIVGFLVLAIGVTLQQVVLGPGDVTLNRLVGALCLYLLLGVLWAVLFGMVELVEPSAFDYGAGVSDDLLEHFMYYSFVTLTTLGYGDVTPIHPVARTLAYLEAVVGQLYVAVLVASLVARHVAGLGSTGSEGEAE
jgi:voltage-gated potassium channel